jgi:spore coat protein U-like protein
MMTGSIALAGGKNTLTVKATVTGTGKFMHPTSTILFILDPSSAADAAATTTATFWCTKGTTFGITSGNGLNYSGASKRMKSTGTPTEFIPYSVALTPSGTLGLGPGTPLVLTLDGSILNANYVNALAANDYTDTVVITIAP